MVKTRQMGRRSQSGRYAGDATRETIAEYETRQGSLKENNPEQPQTITVELSTTESMRNTDNTPEVGMSRKRRTRSSTLMDLSNAARDISRENATDNAEEDIIDITDGWEMRITRRKPKTEKELSSSMVEFGREMRLEVDYVAVMQRVRILPSVILDKRTPKKLGIEESVAYCLRGMETNKFVRRIGETYEAAARVLGQLSSALSG